MALPEGNESLTMAESVEISLEGLSPQLEAADMALVTAARLAAKAIDAMIQENPIEGRIKSLQYHYMVTGALEKLGGSVKARKELGTKPEKPKSQLAAVRGIRDKSGNNQGGKERKPAARRTPAARKKAV